MGCKNDIKLVDESRLRYAIDLLKDLIDKKIYPEELAKVAKTGSYNDLLDKPFIPVKTSELINDIKFITLREVSDIIGEEKARAIAEEMRLNSIISSEAERAEEKEEELSSSINAEKERIDTINQIITTIESDIDDLNERVDDIDGVIDEKLVPIETKLNTIEEGAQANIIESISVNNKPVSVVGKNVDITIEENDSISNEEIEEIWNTAIPTAFKNVNRNNID